MPTLSVTVLPRCCFHPNTKKAKLKTPAIPLSNVNSSHPVKGDLRYNHVCNPVPSKRAWNKINDEITSKKNVSVYSHFKANKQPEEQQVLVH